MGFSRQEYWGGLLFPSLVNLPDPGIEHGSPALQADSLPTELKGKPRFLSLVSKTSLNIWKFMVHILVKPSLENFEHYFTSV